MAGSTIGSKLTTGVTLGSTAALGIYISPLTITPTGYIAPSNYGVVGVTGSITAGYVLNQGAIAGGPGKQGEAAADGSTGGGGVGLTAGSLMNNGTVTGGSGGVGGTGFGNGGDGGYGVNLVGALLANSGVISGGDGGPGNISYGALVVAGTTDAIVENGIGGTGGTGGILNGGILINSGTLSGGAGGTGAFGGAGGIGLVVRDGSVTNPGVIIGGQPGQGPGGQNYGGGIGAAVYTGGMTNTGTINGGSTPLGSGGGADGILIAGGNVVNHGTINGGSGGASEIGAVVGGAGAALSGGSLTNDGLIRGGEEGVDKVGVGAGAGVTVSGGSLINHGTIIGANGLLGIVVYGLGGFGVDLSVGTLTNDGTIIGGNNHGVGVTFDNGGTLTNGGLIAGGNHLASATTDAVNFGNGASRLILLQGAVFTGAVVANAAYTNVLELTSGSGLATIMGLGDTISGFQAVTIDPGAAWFVGGNTAGLAAGQTIDGFTVHDIIELTGITATGSSYVGGILTLASAGGPVMLDLPGDFTTDDFIVTNAAAGADITIVCFRAGTRIRVTGGNVPVEELCIGEPVLVLAHDGRLVPRPIVWIGHRSVDCRRHPSPHLVWPVRIRAGTFGPDAPCRDLFLSPDHAVFVDGALIPVKYLINDGSIEQVPMDEVTYFHIELQEHSVLLAEDLATESYLDTGDRTKFYNGGKQPTLFPDFPTRTWEAAGCAPLVVTGATLATVRRRINGGERVNVRTYRHQHQQRPSRRGQLAGRHPSLAHCTDIPPSTATIAPVTKDA